MTKEQAVEISYLWRSLLDAGKPQEALPLERQVVAAGYSPFVLWHEAEAEVSAAKRAKLWAKAKKKIKSDQIWISADYPDDPEYRDKVLVLKVGAVFEPADSLVSYISMVDGKFDPETPFQVKDFEQFLAEFTIFC